MLKQGAVRKLSGESTPIYRRLENDLRSRIQTGEWRAGAMILGRQRLSKEYNVHVRTVERAIKALVDDGILETQGTRGTFVATTSTDLVETPAVHPPSAPFGYGYKLSRPCTVGIVTTDDPPSSETETILRSLEKSLSHAGGNVIYINRTTRGRGLIQMETAVETLLSKHAQAIVSLNYNFGKPMVDEFKAMVHNPAVPVIYVTAVTVNMPIWNVYYDSIDAGLTATKHLIDRGCKSFLYLASQHFQWADERLEGAREALRRADMSDDCLQVRFEVKEDENDLLRTQAAKRAALEVFANTVPQGIIAVNDHMAKGVVDAAQECGLAPGTDFLLVGFDDSQVARSCGISSMRPPVDEMGAAAAALTVRALEGDPTHQRVCLSSHLIARNSTNGKF